MSHNNNCRIDYSLLIASAHDPHDRALLQYCHRTPSWTLYHSVIFVILAFDCDFSTFFRIIQSIAIPFLPYVDQCCAVPDREYLHCRYNLPAHSSRLPFALRFDYSVFMQTMDI